MPAADIYAAFQTTFNVATLALAAIAIVVGAYGMHVGFKSIAFRSLVLFFSAVTPAALLAIFLLFMFEGPSAKVGSPEHAGPLTQDPSVIPLIPIDPGFVPAALDAAHHLKQAAAKWRNHTWPVGQSLKDLIEKVERSPPDLDDPTSQTELDLIKKAELIVSSRQSSSIDKSIPLCLQPDSGGDYEANNAIVSRLFGIISQRGLAESTCSSTDIVLRVKAIDDRKDGGVTVSAAVSAYWNYDNSPISRFPIYRKETGSAQFINGLGTRINGEAAYRKVSAELGDAVFKNLYGG